MGVAEHIAMVSPKGSRTTGLSTDSNGGGVGPRPVLDGKFFRRDGRRMRVQGVTYGPFAPDADGRASSRRRRGSRDDFARCATPGSTRSAPTTCRRTGSSTWPTSAGWRSSSTSPGPSTSASSTAPGARPRPGEAVRAGGRARPRPRRACWPTASATRSRPTSSAGTARRRVERFLAELRDVAKQADPDGLVTYANFPPTEYLDLSFLDFATFNVYLHDREAFRRYLFRLQNLVGDRPLLLGELGMDTLRHGEAEQAEFLAGPPRARPTLMGLAGAFVFSWTDDWHTGGHRDRGLGLRHHRRRPRAQGRRTTPCARSSRRRPRRRCCRRRRGSRWSSARTTAGRTLDQCLRSLLGARLPGLRGDRRRRRLDRRHAGDRSRGSPRSAPSTRRTGA